MADPPVIDSDGVAPSVVRDRIARTRQRIAEAGGDPETTTIVAVTKGFGPGAVTAALDAGVRALGENYAQELLAKAAALPDATPVDWHFLGRLQTNKVRQIAPLVALWQSVDRAELIREIAKRAPGGRVLVQINLSEETNKGGCTFADVPFLVGLARDEGLDVQGLMGVGVLGDPAGTSTGFARLVGLAEAMELPVRSIGMSADFEAAVRAGSTMIRIGTGFFGHRPTRTDAAHEQEHD